MLSLWRAGAGFNATILLDNIPGRQGGNCNTEYSKIFAFISLLCFREILSAAGKVVYEQLPEKFIVHDPDDFIPSFEIPTEKQYNLNIGSRSRTEVVFMPSVLKHHSYVIQAVFKCWICTWLNFGICYVRFAVPDDNCFANLHCSVSSPTVIFRKMMQDYKIIALAQILCKVVENCRLFYEKVHMYISLLPFQLVLHSVALFIGCFE